LILCLVMSRFSGGFHLSSVSWNAGCIIIGMALSFSSLPLLSYLSYELILIGYLPNYRIFIVGLSMAIIVYSNFLITRHVQRQKELNDSSSADFPQDGRSTESPMPWQYLSQYLPPAIPLLQGIVIGGLQDWGLVQVLLLMGTEIILLLHMATSLRGRLFLSISAWCNLVRLLTVCLSITFACSPNETTKQWVGYIMLCLHGIMVIFGFLPFALWRLTQTLRGSASTVLRNNSSAARVSHSITYNHQVEKLICCGSLHLLANLCLIPRTELWESCWTGWERVDRKWTSLDSPVPVVQYPRGDLVCPSMPPKIQRALSLRHQPRKHTLQISLPSIGPHDITTRPQRIGLRPSITRMNPLKIRAWILIRQTHFGIRSTSLWNCLSDPTSTTL
jgi:hypothetical protein